MTLSQVISMVDDIKPNAFTNATKTGWVNECEGVVQTEVMLLAVADVVTYDYTTDANEELLAAAPHDKLYRPYLCAMIDFANGEYDKYENSMKMYNAYMGEYVRWYARTYHPADGAAEEAGYYISAYSLAVKHGYTGTEAEWVASLKGAKGDAGATGPAGPAGPTGNTGPAGPRGEFTSLEITLPAADWAGKSQTVNVAGVTAANTVVVAAKPTSHYLYCKGRCYCSEQGDGTLTFKCADVPWTTVPTTDLDVNILIMD